MANLTVAQCWCTTRQVRPSTLQVLRRDCQKRRELVTVTLVLQALHLFKVNGDHYTRGVVMPAEAPLSLSIDQLIVEG